ncbi:MAG TPA: hypothetical protein VHB50_09910, partial [Bryobacteraceae bacterium]|nr:hypothetical protein [Bryobacteraceae bacterium]
GGQNIVARVHQMPHQLEEAGIAGEELNLIECDDLEPASGRRLFRAQDGPQFIGSGGGYLLGGVFIALAALDAVHAAPGIGPRFEDGDLFISVFPKSIDFRQQMACLAGGHIADKQSQKLSPSQPDISRSKCRRSVAGSGRFANQNE